MGAHRRQELMVLAEIWPTVVALSPRGSGAVAPRRRDMAE